MPLTVEEKRQRRARFAANLTELATQGGWTPASIAKELKLNYSTVYAWWVGSNLPTEGSRQALANCIGVPLSSLLQGCDVRKPDEQWVTLSDVRRAAVATVGKRKATQLLAKLARDS